MNVFDLKIQWKNDFKKFILPYYKESKQHLDIKSNYKNYLYTFSKQRVEFVEYTNLNWYDSLKYARGKGWLTDPYVEYLGKTDMTFLKSLLDGKYHRRVRQTIELCCDLFNKEPTMFPVKIGVDRIHPGNTLVHSLKILQRGCRMIRVVDFNYIDEAIIIKKLNSLQDIQNIYTSKKIYAFFVNKEKHNGLQVLVLHNNFNAFDHNGNLQWKSDKQAWPFDTFLNKLSILTDNILNSELISFTYNEKNYKIKIPHDNKLQKSIFIESIKWGNENIIF